MCGITGMISTKEFSVKDSLIKSLRRLEYRGYDSSGFATIEGSCLKAKGYISNLISKIDDQQTKIGIAHTRWATHGGVNETNSHPHFNSEKTIFAVHNGIIENFAEMKNFLEVKGYKFISETDSEIVPHYLDYQIKQGKKVREAMSDFMNEAKGTFAIIFFVKGRNKLYAMKRDSPLALGITKDYFILASDLHAFANETNKAIFFEDDECAVVEPDKYEFFNMQGSVIEKKVNEFKIHAEEQSKKEHKHYMIKEILEQPYSSQRLIDSFKIFQKESANQFADMIRKAKNVVFLSCGTSYHASLVGVYMLNKAGIPSHTVIASEFENFLMVGKDTLVIPISQSGETMDVVTVLKEVKKKGAKIASIVNVPFSTIQRLSDISLEIMAGPEISVASTKAFTNQVIALIYIATKLGYDADISKIPSKITRTINENKDRIKKTAEDLYKHKDIFVLGKAASYPMAREIALKLKEIAYIHAEGMMAGELKHGTIALIEKGTPVISLIPNCSHDMVSSTKEVEARGAKTLVVSNNEKIADILVPESCNAEFAVYSGIVGHLLSYYIADLLRRPIDKPRNLAKSVTVK